MTIVLPEGVKPPEPPRPRDPLVDLVVRGSELHLFGSDRQVFSIVIAEHRTRRYNAELAELRARQEGASVEAEPEPAQTLPGAVPPRRRKRRRH